MTDFNVSGKVICIGWHKTGTTTIGDALLILGYSVLGARLDLANFLKDNELEKILDVAQDFDALQDVPWNVLYKSLDKKYPGSKFILTVRDEEKWLKSASKHFGDHFFRMHEVIYGEGILLGNEELYIEKYREHNQNVRDYFVGRKNDFIEIDLNNEANWKVLCEFLDKPIPKKKFPHSNKGSHNFSSLDKVKVVLRNLVPMPIRKLRLKILGVLGFPDPRYRFNNRIENEKERFQGN
jgi:hypothetical protein